MTLAINKPTVHEIFSSAARGTTTSNVFATMNNNSVVLQLDATAVSGTNPTLDLVVQDGPSETGPWSTLYTFTQVTAAANQVAMPTRNPLPFIRAVGTVGGTATPLVTYTLNAVEYQTTALSISTGSQGGTAAFTGLTVTSASANAATVGLNGATNPALQVDASTASSATGLKIKSAAAASGVALSVISSGTNENLTIDAKGSGTISLNVTGTGNIVLGRAATGVSLAVTGAVTSSGTAGIGYATGAGGTVTQATSKATGVTLNKVTGAITMNNAALNAGVEVTFAFTNSTIAATDVVVVNHSSAGTSGSYFVQASNFSAGACDITVTNLSAGNLSEAIVLTFVVLKGVAA
jgi:hypothetical protein